MKNHSLLRTLLGAATIAWTAGLAASGARAQSTTTYNFSILAGQGAVLDHTDGSGTSARLFNPTAIAVDASGNLYVADAGDHTVRLVSGNQVSTIGGTSGQPGSTGNHLVYPAAIAVDAGHNVYVADMGDDTIKKIPSGGGSVSIVAGIAGQPGSADGGALAGAKFNGPQGIAVDAAGNIYVADTNNSTIRMISTTGVVSTLAGTAGNVGSADGSKGAASFNFPSGLALDAQGNLYVADYDNSIIRLVTPAGGVSTIAGSAGATGAVNGPVASARFDHPNAVGVDAAGNIYVLDTSNQLVRKISAGAVSTLAGTADVIGRADGAGVAASFFYPLGLAASSGGTVYVADTGNHSIRTISGGSVSTLAGSAGTPGLANGNTTSATFRFPYGAALDGSGNLYIADSGNNAIRKISSTGAVSTLAGGSLRVTGAPASGFADGSGAAATFNNPSALVVDGSGNVYVADTGNSTIRKVTAAGQVSTYAGSAGSQGGNDGAVASARFNRPVGIAIDSQGNLYVADTGNNSVRKIVVSTGQVSTVATGFNQPTSVAVDSVGNLYVSDFGNDTIRRFDSQGHNGVILAGSPLIAGDADGSGGAAAFNQPSQIAVDSGGNVYVADTFNRAIRIVNTSGQVYTVGGAQSRFLYPQGIAIDSASGNLYVVDGDNQTVSVGIPVVVVAPQSGEIANHSAAVGGSTTFTYGTAAPGTTFQWQVSTNGGATWSPVPGGTSASLNVTGITSAMNGYQYRVVVNNSHTTSAGTLYVGTTRIINLSSRTVASPGAPVTAGFYVGGSGTKNLLVRGIGPTLGQYGVPNPMADPSITLNAAGSAAFIASNTGWGGGATLANAMNAVGAFTLPATSADSALLTGLTVNGNTGYTETVSSASGGTGNVLAEIYDMDTTGTPSTRLINISTMAHVDGSNTVITSGFVITGTGKETVLIRGDGPSLGAFGVNSPVATPMLTLYDSKSNPITTNTGWGSSAAISTATAQVYAFALTPGSNDAAIIVSLDPGLYTVQVSGNGGAAGMAMLEVYEVK